MSKLITKIQSISDIITNSSFEDWCFRHDSECWEGSPFVERFVVTAKNPRDVDKANKLNQIYSIFESETRYC